MRMRVSTDLPPRDLPLQPASLPEVLAEIADTAAETLELQAVIERVATSMRRLMPLDNIAVVRILDGKWAVRHAATLSCKSHQDLPTVVPADVPSDCCRPLSDWSPRLRPRAEGILRVADASTELDPRFPIDRMLLEMGVGSTMWEPFRTPEGFGGGVSVSAYAAHAFTAEHQEMLRPIAALLGSAVEHWRIWDVERRRRRRLDQLETLLATLAESLDVREVFDRMSAAAQPFLPHDAVVLTELDLGARALRLIAISGKTDNAALPERIDLSDGELDRRALDFELLRDLQVEADPSTERNRLMRASGMRSWLRVPVRLAGETRGSLGFFHRDPARYDGEDVEIACRLADRVALMLSHKLLAEEAQVAAAERERAERLAATVETLTRELEEKRRHPVVGESQAWREVLLQVGRVASADTSVLITGESGTGKEIVADLIRQGSTRSAKPYVAVNCAALPEQLLESELFGHEKGAFTGAIATKIGRLEQAAGGTLFLDEIGEMSPLVQAKLLRVLQEREFQRLGGTRVLRADVRLIAATNRDLRVAIGRGQFRDDLYYRLNVFEIHIPPLRERREDVLPLADAFLEELAQTLGRRVAGISRDAREWLLAYPWPGNVRELRNAIERAILLCDGGLITRAHLSLPAARPEPAAGGVLDAAAPLPVGGVDLEEVERSLVERALREARGNKSRAARLLGLTRAQLYSRIEKYSLG